ncbi:hypothetical protein VHUM_00587 [Vanrija humicola]|uniref:Metallo-beta-lactamase domain-containing protein n=1 Tax=Vanrija humicola TaxID=5417 RepID=A0A7D8Z8H5_VANHU|nr:hypothetical protein VHUM_00587 [Vanrija humicola]
MASTTPFDQLAPESSDPRDANLVIREVVPGLLTFSIPFARFGWVPIGGRSTAVRLNNGDDIWVYVSHPYTDATDKALKQLGGKVKWLVTPDGEHGMNIKAWAEQFPDAQPIGVKRFGHEKPDVKWAGLFRAGGEDKKYGFEDEITLYNVSAHVNDELAAIHHPSGTLIQGDLLFNLPATEQYSRAGGLPYWIRALGGGASLSPGGILHSRFANVAIKDKELGIKQLAPIFAAKFDRIIPCHGDVIETGGKKAWDEAFAAYREGSGESTSS